MVLPPGCEAPGDAEPWAYPAEVGRWPFARKPRREHSLGEYIEPSFRGAVLMLVISLVVLTLLWLAYSWALNQPGIHDPNAILDPLRPQTAALRTG